MSSPAGVSRDELNIQGRMRGLPRLATGPGTEAAHLSPRADATEAGRDDVRQGRSRAAGDSVINLCSDSEASFHECTALGDESDVCIID